MRFLFLASLLIALGGMALGDWYYKLVLFFDWRRGFRVLAIGLVFFIIWDLCGIHLNIFFSGQSRFMTGLMIVQNLYVEEPLFLLLLIYFSLLLWRSVEKICSPT